MVPGVAWADDDYDPADPTEAYALPVLHAYGGAAFDMPFQARREPIPAFGVNVGGSVEVWHKEGGYWGVWLSPELGYAGRLLEHDDFHSAMAGFGVGIGNRWAFASIKPRLYLGAADGDFSGMIGHVISGHFLLEIVRLELSHEILFAPGQVRNFLTPTLSLDLVVALMAIANS